MTGRGTVARSRIAEIIPTSMTDPAAELDAARDAIDAAALQLARAFGNLIAAEMRMELREILSRIPSAPSPVMASSANMDVKSAMAFLGISRDRLYKEIKSKRLKSLKIGGRRLFRPADLEAFRTALLEGERW
jgi:excisionase family DNA binding protein